MLTSPSANATAPHGRHISDSAAPSVPPSQTGVLARLMNRKQLANDLRCSERTIIRFERAGLPFIRLGMQRLYEPEKVLAWVLTHEQCPKPVVRGRPANKRAA